MNLLPIYIIAGPTASGKTSFAIKLAESLRKKRIYSEIVNADSIQLYNELKILTAFSLLTILYFLLSGTNLFRSFF